MLKNTKRTRPTLTAFNAMQAERDAACEAVKVLNSLRAEQEGVNNVLKDGLDNIDGRLMDIECAVRALDYLSQHRQEAQSLSALEHQRIGSAERWVIGHLMEEIRWASETAEETGMGRRTTPRGRPVAALQGGAA